MESVADARLFAATAAGAWLVILATAAAVPIGVSVAVALDAYGVRRRWACGLDIALAALAGVPSIVSGVIGLVVFVHLLGIADVALAGAATLALVMLPLIVIATREALGAVPLSRREASLALGATRWQTMRRRVLPDARPGLLAGLAATIARALGEASPLIVIAAATHAARVQGGGAAAPMALPVLIVEWTSSDGIAWRADAATAIIVLLLMVLPANALAIWLRGRGARRRSA